MFDHYKALVLLDYQKKKSAGTLSHNLVHPTPAKVKAECIHVCEERFSKDDEGVLRIFFRQQNGPPEYMQAIKQRDTDTFKPLCNFLKGGTTNTEGKNVELLAWLIEFEHRPYATWKNMDKRPDMYESNETPPVVNAIEAEREKKERGSGSGSLAIIPESCESKPEVTVSDRPTSLNRRNIFLLTSLMIVACVGAYLIDSHVSGNGVSWEQEECMYWDRDHYQPVRCNKKIDGVHVYALDTAKVTRMRKINKPDTITRMAIGTVWYSKIDGNVEFFTCDGFHPIVTARRLKPVTELIIDKYARRKITP